MKEDAFEEVLSSVRQAGRIKRRVMEPSRRFSFAPDDVRAIRNRLGFSQAEFALLIGISVATLQNWEQGRRHPRGPARALLRVAERTPEALLKALAG